MDDDQNGTHALHIPLTGQDLDALASMARDDLRDLRTEAYFSLRRVLIERGYLPGPGAANVSARSA